MSDRMYKGTLEGQNAVLAKHYQGDVSAPKPYQTRGSLEILRDMRRTADDMIDLAIVCGGELDACTAQVGGELLRQLALELAKGGK